MGDHTTGPPHILVIDDEETLREVLREVLEILGYHPVLAHSGESGIELLKRHGSRIRLVLLDVLMPDLNGIATYHKLRAVDPEIKIVFMSGYPDKDALEIRSIAENFGFIRKPFTVEEIKTTIDELIQ